MKKYILYFSILLLAFCSGNKAQDEHEDHVHQAPAQSANTHETAEAESPAQEGQEHVHEGEGTEQAELHVPLEKQKEWGIEWTSLVPQNISSRITIPGVLSLNQNRTAHISSFIHGQVASLSADLGSKVRKGQPLIILHSPEFAQAQARFLQARAKFLLSQKEYERAKMLLKEKAIEEKEYLRREAEFQKLSTEYGALESALHSYGITHEQIENLIKKCEFIESQEARCEITDPNLPLLSPASGTIIFRDAIKGDHVEPKKILFTVSDLRNLWATLDAYEKDIPLIHPTSQVTIKLSLYPDKTFSGKISYISDLIDEKLRTVKIRVEVSNKEGLLKPNMYIQGIIENRAEEQQHLAIPEGAIQNEDGKPIVFVVEGEDIFEIRHVVLGKKIGQLRIITEGVEKGERVVIKGAFYLKTELSKATFGHTHVH